MADAGALPHRAFLRTGLHGKCTQALQSCAHVHDGQAVVKSMAQKHFDIGRHPPVMSSKPRRHITWEF
jgi:hypothetical protein